MSWEAVAWANRQRLKLPLEQFVLLVLANCADPAGAAFAKWPGKDHWWKYLSDLTRMSKGTVFRHLRTIEEHGLGTRSWMVLADGTRRPIFQLDLTKTVDLSAEDETESQSHDETEPEATEYHHETEALSDQSNDRTDASLTMRPTQSHGETPHIIGFQRDSIPPNPPGGGGQVDQEFEQQVAEAQRLYPIPITNLPRFRSVWTGQDRAARPKILTAMRGFAAFIAECERKKKPRAVKDADRWVASGMWQGYLPAGERAEAVEQISEIAIASDAGKAWEVLHRIAHISPTNYGGKYRTPRPLSERVLALAQAPPEARWVFVAEDQTKQVGAYHGLLKELGDRARPALVWKRFNHPSGAAGFFAPWPFPPSTKGKIYETTGPPPLPQPSEEDLNEFAKTG